MTLTEKDIDKELNNVSFNEIDITYFPIEIFNNLQINQKVIYRKYTGNTDIPYIEKVLKKNGSYPQPFVVLYNEKHNRQITYFREINNHLYNSSISKFK